MHVAIAAILLGVPISLNAAQWEATAKIHKLQWGGGFAEAYSDPGLLVSVGFSPSEHLVVEGELGQVSSRFRGFRPPAGEMDSTFLAVTARFRLPITRRVAGFIAGGAAAITHDRVADDGFGFQAGVGADLMLTHRIFVRFDGRYFAVSGGSDAAVRNPETLLTAGVGVKFGRPN